MLCSSASQSNDDRLSKEGCKSVKISLDLENMQSNSGKLVYKKPQPNPPQPWMVFYGGWWVKMELLEKVVVKIKVQNKWHEGASKNLAKGNEKRTVILFRNDCVFDFHEKTISSLRVKKSFPLINVNELSRPKSI